MQFCICIHADEKTGFKNYEIDEMVFEKDNNFLEVGKVNRAKTKLK